MDKSSSTNKFNLQHRLRLEATNEKDPALLRAWSDWHEQPPTRRQCLEPSSTKLLDASIHIDDVGSARNTGDSRTRFDTYLSPRLEVTLGYLGECIVDLEGNHGASLAYHLRENRAEVPSAGTHLDDALAHLQITGRHTAGLKARKSRRDATLGRDAHPHILIDESGIVADHRWPALGEVPGARAHELVSRHFAECLEETRIRQTRALHHNPCEDAPEIGKPVHLRECTMLGGHRHRRVPARSFPGTSMPTAADMCSRRAGTPSMQAASSPR